MEHQKSNMIKIIVQNNPQLGANCRIDKYLSCDENLNGKVTRSGLTKLFTDNKITINGVPIKKSQKVLLFNPYSYLVNFPLFLNPYLCSILSDYFFR